MKINFDKYADRLAPAIVQDPSTRRVLMLGYMNADSLEQTEATGLVTFYSRSRQRLWTKGETSGNHLYVEEISTDCDADAILIKATATGPVCHTGADTCFKEPNETDDFLFSLEEIILERKVSPKPESYTSKLFSEGLNKIAQKVGEETVELIIEAKDSDDERFKNEAADLLYHLLVLFAEKNIGLREITEILRTRHRRAR